MPLHVTSLTLLRDQYPTAEHYPFTLPLLRETERLEFDSPVTIFVGENGSGKSTLLTALAQACGVHIWKLASGLQKYQHNPYEERLHQYVRVTRPDGPVPGSFFCSENFEDFTLLLDEWAACDPGQLKHFGGESLVTKSHGQSMMSLFRERYKRRLMETPKRLFPVPGIPRMLRMKTMSSSRDCFHSQHINFLPVISFLNSKKKFLFFN